MTRQQILLTLFITFLVCFIIALTDSGDVRWDCTFTCMHLHGKIAFVVGGLCVLGFVLTGLIRKKR